MVDWEIVEERVVVLLDEWFYWMRTDRLLRICII